jgi:hypothetical protein
MDNQKLARIEVIVERLEKKIDEQHQEDRSWKDKVGQCLHGENGVRIRVDRLEQSEKRRSWRERTIFVALFGLIAKAVSSFFS